MSALAEHEPQRLRALRRADAIRMQRVCMKRWIREPRETMASRERAIEVLLDPPEHALGMPVDELVVACFGIGNDKMRRLLAKARIGEKKQIGRLTLRQALELAGLLRQDGACPTLWDVLEDHTQPPTLG